MEITERGQIFTLEAAISLIIVSLITLYILFAVPLTPLTSSAANVMVENKLEFLASDVLNVACYRSPGEDYSPMKQALLYWDGEIMYGAIYDYPWSYNLKVLFDSTFGREGIAYNIDIGYYTYDSQNNTVVYNTARFVWNGYPSDNAVTVTKTIVLYDSDPANQGVKVLTYNIDGNETNFYNVIEVRLTVWRM